MLQRMLECDNICKTLNFIMDSFLLSGLTQRGSCTECFFGDETLFEHYGVYVDMKLCGAKFSLKLGILGLYSIIQFHIF